MIREYFLQSKTVLTEFLADSSNIIKIDKASDTICSAFNSGKKVISCGNGGSMSDAMHFAEELSGRYRNDRKALAAISISDPTHITCVGNDYGFDHIFSRYIDAVGSEGDVLLAISTSGNSKNVINAIESAKKKGMFTIGLTGKDGGKLALLVDIEIRVPHFGYADHIQEVHIKIIHSLILSIESKMGLII